ncbi:VOC family protein [Lysinibacter cavernae]|uniref:VOC domain-containing protein n=1 Tax=Lysinibacter cavernae TaxID=1640652 RepID=A0A7X5R0S1_9MICO|nr:VOC family protein [Lysinibacter cavernae]NIH53342.1 hypothetical protein [Lysinibacter cavernae]
MTAIGTLQYPVLDCEDALELAEFYQNLIGGEIVASEDDTGWVELIGGAGGNIAFQRIDDFVPATWPGGQHPAQAHFDVVVKDIDWSEAAVIACGARTTGHPIVPLGEPTPHFRVYLDPASHPFCLVWND